MALARQLERDHIPILLTILVDSISKPGHDDHVIPANVGRAINFYQTRGPLHGKPIIAADPARTEILGDFRLSYKKEPEPCSTYPWFARHLLKGYTAIECDPTVWSRVEGLIAEYLFPQKDWGLKPVAEGPAGTSSRPRVAPETLGRGVFFVPRAIGRASGVFALEVKAARASFLPERSNSCRDSSFPGK